MLRKSPPTYYEILGIDEKATEIDISFAARRSPILGGKKELIDQAIETLSDPIKRKRYDKKLAAERKKNVKPVTKKPAIEKNANPTKDVPPPVAAGKTRVPRKRALSQPMNSTIPPISNNEEKPVIITREISDDPSRETAPSSDTVEIRSARITCVLSTEAEEEPIFLLTIINQPNQLENLVLPRSAIKDKYLDFLDEKSLALLNNPILQDNPILQEESPSFILSPDSMPGVEYKAQQNVILSDIPRAEKKKVKKAEERASGEILPIKPLRGFFHPFYKDRRANLPVAVEARKLLDAVSILHQKSHYQKIYFTCLMNLAMADDVEKGYKKGERLTHARKHYHRKNREAKLMMMVEKLLATPMYQHLRSFYIAPMSTCAKPGGKGAVTEETTRSQLENIQEKLDQGHAVFCLTDEASWQAEKPLSMVEEKLSVNKGDEITFSPAQNQLAQETLVGFQRDYPMPEAVFNVLQKEEDLRGAIKVVGQMKVTTPSAPKSKLEKMKNEFKLLHQALTDAHLLKTWPFRINIEGVHRKYSTYAADAITTRQKRRAIIEAMKIISPKITNKKIIFPEDKALSEASPECKQLARKYALRIAGYLSYHAIPPKSVTDPDLSSEVNRVKLAMILRASLKKVYSPAKENEELFDTQDFFDIVDSAESYAVELRGTHSKLQTILNDLAWETSFLKKAHLSQEKQEKIPTFDLEDNNPVEQNIVMEPESSLLFVNSDDVTVNPPKDLSNKTFADHPDFIKRFREAKDDSERVMLLKEHLAREIDKTYGENRNKGLVDFHFRHTSDHTANRIKNIETNDLTQYSRILIAEFRGQGSSSKSIKPALKKALDTLAFLLPELSQSTLRFVALQNAAQLLEYANKRERSLAYTMSTIYARTFTSQHIKKAEELAYSMLQAETPEALYKVILEASEYKTHMLKSLRKRQSEEGFNEANFDSNERHSSLVSILDTIEKDFESVFRNQSLTERKSMDVIWQEAFGGAYLDTKFKMVPKEKKEVMRVRLKPEDELQKRCYHLAKEMQQTKDPQTKSYQEARMSALIDAMLTSKYPQILGKEVREKINVKDLERPRWQLPAVYYAQRCLAKMDEVETERTTFKAYIEKTLQPFLTPQKGEPADLLALHMTIKALAEAAKNREHLVGRFFSPSRLRTFLENFSRELEQVDPVVQKQARIINSKTTVNKKA